MSFSIELRLVTILSILFNKRESFLIVKTLRANGQKILLHDFVDRIQLNLL